MVASIRSLHLVSKTEHDAGQSTYAVKLVQSIHALNKLDSGNQSSIRARKQRELRDKKRAEKVKNMTALGGTVTRLGMCLLGWGRTVVVKKQKTCRKSICPLASTDERQV